jgi:general nucleoside transport system permease protein
VALVAEDHSVDRDFGYDWIGGISGVLVPVLSVLFALLVGAFVVLAFGDNPIDAYSQLKDGSFGSWYNFSETVVSAIPLMLAGLAVAFTFRAGLFNIGAEGQVFMGAICSAFVGYKLNMPGFLLIPIALGAGALGGGIWAGIAGVLKATRGAHEVITTMMLNYTAILISQYLLESSPQGKPGPMQQTILPGNPQTPPMNATLPVIVPQAWIANGRLHAGIVVALVAAMLFGFILWRTSLGYKIRAVGLNSKAAAFAGIGVGWNIIIAMFIAGAFAGLAGMVQIFGIYPYTLTDSFSPGYGFDAIAVALLGRNNPIGVIFAALLFGAFDHGGAIMQSNTNISIHLVEILQGLVIFFIGADALMRYLSRKGLVSLPLWQEQKAA